MPSNRAILADLEANGLKPTVAHSAVGADGRLRKPDTKVEVVENKSTEVEKPVEVETEVHSEHVDEHSDAKKKHKKEKKEKPVSQ